MNGMSGTLGTKVSKDDVVSVINQTAGAVKISANCIDLEGYVTASEFETVAAYTQVFKGGEISGLTMEAVEGTFSNILADDGRIPMLTVSNAGGFGINVEQMDLTVYDSGYHTFIVTKTGTTTLSTSITARFTATNSLIRRQRREKSALHRRLGKRLGHGKRNDYGHQNLQQVH